MGENPNCKQDLCCAKQPARVWPSSSKSKLFQTCRIYFRSHRRSNTDLPAVSIGEHRHLRNVRQLSMHVIRYCRSRRARVFEHVVICVLSNPHLLSREERGTKCR